MSVSPTDMAGREFSTGILGVFWQSLTPPKKSQGKREPLPCSDGWHKMEKAHQSDDLRFIISAFRMVTFLFFFF